MLLFPLKISTLRHPITSLIMFFGLSFAPVANADLDSGNYTYSNAQYTLRFTIDGMDIKNATLTTKSSGQVVKQTAGQYMRQGSMEWYQFQTEKCSYEFDTPDNSLKLRWECKDSKGKSTTATLKKN